MSKKTILSFLVIIAIFIYAKSLPQQKGKVQEASDVKVTPTPTQEPTPTPSPTPEPVPTTRPMPTHTPTPISTNQQGISLSAFAYPGAAQVRSDAETLVLETSDSPDTVTEWYKNRIKSFSMNTRSFVQTTTNGNVLNKLVSDNGNMQVRVEITKKASDSITKITVVVEPS